MPTVRDIAAVARVHFTTVAKALRDDPCVHEVTRRRIKEIATELGYRPNPMVAALMHNVRGGRLTRRPITLAFCTYWTVGGREGWKKLRTHRLYFEGAKERAAEMGYRIDHFNLADDTIGPARWSRIFVARGISGLVLASFQDVVPDLPLAWPEFSAVRIDTNPQNPHLDTVSANQSHLVRMAFRKANELGYRRIGIAVHALWDERLGDQFMGGYLTEQMKVPASRRLPPFITHDWTERGFARWFAKAKPDALLAMNDEVVRGWLKQPGLEYREPFGFVSLDLTVPAGPIAGARKNHRLLGAIAVDTLIGKLQRNERGVPEYPKLTLVEAQWNDGLSLGPAKKR